jgi:hypothetical protein
MNLYLQLRCCKRIWVTVTLIVGAQRMYDMMKYLEKGGRV